MRTKSEHHEDRRISYIWGGILAGLILFSGIYVYLVMEKQAKLNLSKSLQAQLENKAYLFSNAITQGQGINSFDAIELRHPLFEAMELSNHSEATEVAYSVRSLQKIAQAYIQKNFRAISIYNAKDKKLVSAGQFSAKPQLRVALDKNSSSFLLWEGQFVLYSSNRIYSHNQYLGKVITEKVMPLLTRAFNDVEAIGKTGEFAICKSLPQPNDMQCFLNGFNGKKFFTHQKRIIKGKSLPMDYALKGKQGLIFARDYRKEDVVAAYAPVGIPGMGMVIKIDQNELYHPITNNLKYIISMLAATVFIGILLMRLLVTPLVRNLVKSEKDAKAANIDLEESRQRYRLVLDNSPYCIHEIDADGCLNSMNPTGLKMLGYDSENKIRGQRYLDSVSKADRPRIAQLLEEALQGKASHFEFKGANGRIYQSSFIPISDKESGSLRLMGWTQDITESRNNEEKLRLSQKMDALGKLTGGIAHDYNNLLAIILGFSELLKDQLADKPELSEYIEQIFNAADRGSRLTSKLLSFSRHKPADTEIININNLLLEDKNMLEKTLTVRINLVFDLTEDLWAIKVDSASLEDAILNLSINAMHAMEQGGELVFKTENKTLSAEAAAEQGVVEGDYVMLCLTDTGTGMDRETLERIFEPFYSTKGEKGTGLGLSQVYGFVKSHQGFINVTSEPGKGTCVCLNFPRNYEIERSVVVTSENGEVEFTGSETILVVDDEPSLLTMSANILGLQGYRVLTAGYGEEALAILEKEHVDLLLSDIIMPGMDGYELTARVSELYPTIKILLMSGYSDLKRKVNQQLHDNIIRKPFSVDSLLKQIRLLLDAA